MRSQLGGQLEDLKTIFNNTYKVPFDQGGVKALIPGSIAYSHLCQTNVTSYAIAGRWNPKATVSHVVQEGLYRNIIENGNFDLDKDGFNDQNDLVVSVKSHLVAFQIKLANQRAIIFPIMIIFPIREQYILILSMHQGIQKVKTYIRKQCHRIFSKMS